MKKILFTLILIFINGCSPLNATDNPAQPTKYLVTRRSTISPATSVVNHGQVTITPTVKVESVPTSISTVIPTMPSSRVETGIDAPLCNLDSSNQIIEIPGSIVYQKYEYQGLYLAGGNELVNLESLVPDGQSIFVFGFSPDGNSIAYSPIPDNKKSKFENVDPVIVVLGADGKRVEHTLDMGWPKKVEGDLYELETFASGNWINNHLIFAYINSKIPDDNPPAPQIGHFIPIVFDPFTGSIETGLLDSLSSVKGLTRYGISPDIRHYLSNSNGISLQEIMEQGSNRVLWKAQSGSFTAFDPINWSPSGEWVAFAMHVGELTEDNLPRTMLISKDGKMAKELENPAFRNWIKDFYWSPNSKYFAFIIPKNGVLSDLVVFDVKNEQLIFLCPFAQTVDHPITDLIWSPDSVWIAVSTYEKPIQVVNILTGQSKELDLVGDVVGWSDKIAVTP